MSFLVLIYLFTLRVRVNSRILKFFNQMTFELYLVHLIVYKIFFSVRDPGIRWYIPMYAVILMLAYITMQADKAVFREQENWRTVYALNTGRRKNQEGLNRENIITEYK